MSGGGEKSHVGFLRKSFIYILLNAMTSVWELGFSGVTVRLPGNGYSTFWALLKIFFIVTAPISAFQFVVTKEVASFSVLEQYGKRRFFVVRTLQYSLWFAVVIIAVGMLVSGYIADSLNIVQALPVPLLFLTIGIYFPIPILYGAVQGMKKFMLFGTMQMSWGLFRLILGAIVVFVFAGGLSLFMGAVITATVLSTIYCFLSARHIFDFPVENIQRSEIMQAYSLVLPVIISLFCMTMMKNIDVVLAKSFFSHGVADAYTCAATVGSGFYILSAIFLVMFPMVSEEKTRGGNPIIFLYKSCGFVLVFSGIGIVIAVLFPELPMYIFTLGKEIPGARSLIRLVGFAVVPISFVNILSNYFLAKHQWRFLPILVVGTALQVGLIFLMNATPERMLVGITIANLATLVGMTVYLVYEHRSFLKQAG